MFHYVDYDTARLLWSEEPTNRSSSVGGKCGSEMIENYYFLPGEYLHFVDDWMVSNLQCIQLWMDGNRNESRKLSELYDNEKTITDPTRA